MTGARVAPRRWTACRRASAPWPRSAGVSFDVRAGEVFSVIGPNGAGKSTLFNVIAGLHVPTSGRIVFGGEEITGLAPEVINRRGLAKTFQITNIFPGISVYDNVRVAAAVARAGVGAIAVALAACPTSRGPSWSCWAPSASTARRDELAQNLSHGEQRYLEICLALATEPTLLLLDEPTAGMTPGGDEGRDGAHPPDRAEPRPHRCC